MLKLIIRAAPVATPNTAGVEIFSGTVQLLRKLDREETGDEVVLTIIATDGGGLTSSILLTITVQDKNDNTPTFQNAADYEHTITEASIEDQYIATVLATDPDKIQVTNLAAISADGVATGYVEANGQPLCFCVCFVCCFFWPTIRPSRFRLLG